MEPCVPHTSHALLECRGVDRAVLGRLRAAAAWHVSGVACQRRDKQVCFHR